MALKKKKGVVNFCYCMENGLQYSAVNAVHSEVL